MKLDKMKKKVSENKFKIIGGVVAGGLLIGATALVTHRWDYIHADTALLKPNEILCGVSKDFYDIPFDKSTFAAGEMVDLWREGEFVNAIITDAKFDALKDALAELPEMKDCDSFDLIISASK